ncbi:MAG: DNA gyrase subunit A [Gemmatimonadota bacterium]
MESTESSDRIEPRLIEDEMRESFIDYSMSVIVQRALPDVRDGLKPVHRRILYAMQEAGLSPTRAHKKSATVVGDVLGKYHPHGDSAVYDSLVRMAQDFSLRYPLVDGQGNFGSIDGDSAAAYRYTEARLTPLAVEMLADFEKETVDYVPNFDDRLQEPTVLPSRLPNLLVNGSSGIAVGMATNVPPHNLREVVAACVHLIDDPDCSLDDLMAYIQGPDFPTGGHILGTHGIREAYETGRGLVIMRALAHTEEMQGGRERIVVTEIPFMVNKTRLIEQIAQLVRDRKLDGVTDLRDESDRDGIRMVIEVRRDTDPRIILNRLYKHTQMQSTFGVIMLALVGGVPQVLSLKQALQHFVDHRHEVVVRRSTYELRVAREREHILQGLKVAVDNIDEVVKVIRKSKDTDEAGAMLRERFELTKRQSDAILNMRLARLTGLEIEKLEAEIEELTAEIGSLEEILGSESLRMSVIKEELLEVAGKYGDDRRTEILDVPADFSDEDLIAEEDMVITVSRTGYVKRIPPDVYRQQRRGGRGIAGMGTKDDDWVEHLYLASSHDYLMCFTQNGQVYWLKVYEVPLGSRTARGKPIVNLLNIGNEEAIASIVPVRDFPEDRNLIFATRHGLVKKTSLAAYSNVRSTGINAINVVEGDRLIDVQLSDGTNDIMLGTRSGMAIRFAEADVREMGRTTRGVKGIVLRAEDEVVGMVVVRRDATLLTLSERGMGKRTRIDEYRTQRRGGIGLINLRITEKTGRVVGVKEVTDSDELIFVTRNGVVNRQLAREIRTIGRATQGVRLVNLDKGDAVVDVARVLADTEDTATLPVAASSETGEASEPAG